MLDLQLGARMKSDEDETLRLAGFTQGSAAWFAEVRDYSFLGKTVTVHRLLAERLARAEAQLGAVTPPAGGWFRSTSSLRGLGQSLHGFGMAIDLDGGRNPYLVNPDARGASAVEPTGRSRAIADIVDRAGLLVRGLTAGAFSWKNGSSVPATRYARGNGLGNTSGGRYPPPGEAQKIAP